jgi:FixJ family two-component response regulator
MLSVCVGYTLMTTGTKKWGRSGIIACPCALGTGFLRRVSNEIVIKMQLDLFEASKPMKPREFNVYVVSEQPEVCNAIKLALHGGNFSIHCVHTAQECLDALASGPSDLLIVDSDMCVINDMKFLCDVRHKRPLLPLLALGSGDVSLAINAIKAGVSDFVKKPFDNDRFLAKVEAIVEQSPSYKLAQKNKLSKTESEILELILIGQCNKRIAQVMNRSVRTIEDHRLNIMRKLDVANMAKLVRKVLAKNSLR